MPEHAPLVANIHLSSVLGRDRPDTVTADELCIPSLELGRRS